MKYRNENVSPHAYLLLFEKRLQECTLAGISIHDSYAALCFYESVVETCPKIHQFAYMYKLLNQVEFVPYNVLKNCFLGVALRVHHSKAYHTKPDTKPNELKDSKTPNPRNAKNKVAITDKNAKGRETKQNSRSSKPNSNSSSLTGLLCRRCPNPDHTNQLSEDLPALPHSSSEFVTY